MAAILKCLTYHYHLRDKWYDDIIHTYYTMMMIITSRRLPVSTVEMHFENSSRFLDLTKWATLGYSYVVVEHLSPRLTTHSVTVMSQ